MNFYDFTKFIITHQSKPPDPKRYPTSITLDSTIWSEIKKLIKYTSQFDYEHSTSIFNVDGEVIATPATKGSKTDVYTRHQIDLKYVPKSKDFYEKQILINGKLVKKKGIRISQIPKQPKITSLFNIHSHPKKILNDQEHYSFFSATDLNTLFSSPSLCMGLVTDKFFLACKHPKSPPRLSQEQMQAQDQVNFQFYNKKQLPHEMLNQLGLVFYEAEISKKLEQLQ